MFKNKAQLKRRIFCIFKPMRSFDADFKDALRSVVEDIESESGAEVVATILPRADRYLATYLLAGLCVSFSVLTVMMFIPTEFWYVLIYLETVGTFLFTVGLMWVFPGITRFLTGRKRMRKRAESEARALFQRAGIVETRERIGILVVFAWFEKEVIFLPDTGAEEMLPPDELDTLRNRLSEVFDHPDPATSILEQLSSMKNTLKVYIPRDIHDINELPDELWLH